jgi:chromosome segregation ATPase
LQDSHQERREIQQENELLQQEIDQIVKKVRKKGGELSNRPRAIIKLELELANAVTESTEQIGNMANCIAKLEAPIAGMRAKLVDLERRVGMVHHPKPVREPTLQRLAPRNGVRLDG